ncbi:acid phosphatase [Gigaspora margarita]|uniref:Acid phosphatase n=1 Tax=Gigaspora margarita TaxID=4874 RepID=A0A8H4EV11_GIGMA|nr:acid phosphatase [Gigaspora margarita]
MTSNQNQDFCTRAVYFVMSNYVAIIYGSAAGITDDGDYDITGQNLIDLLETKRHHLESLHENYTCGVCFTGDNCPLARIFMQDINTNPARCANVVDSSQLDIDISNDQVPLYVILHHYQYPTAYTHYSLIAAVEQNWNLGCLKNDCTATPFTNYLVHP